MQHEYLLKGSSGFTVGSATEQTDGYYVAPADAETATWTATDASSSDEFYLRHEVSDGTTTRTVGLCMVTDGGTPTIGEYVVGEGDQPVEENMAWQLYKDPDDHYMMYINGNYLAYDRTNSTWVLTSQSSSPDYGYAYPVTPGQFDLYCGLSDTATDGEEYTLLSDCPDLYLGMQAMRDDGEDLILQDAPEVQYAGEVTYAIPRNREAECTWTVSDHGTDTFLLTKAHGTGTIALGVLDDGQGGYTLGYTDTESISDYTSYEWGLHSTTSRGYVLQCGTYYMALNSSGEWVLTTEDPDDWGSGYLSFVNLGEKLNPAT